MKILHIISGLNTGGAEMMLHKIIQSIDRARFHSCVVSLKDTGTIGKRIEKEGFKVYSLRTNPLTPIPWVLIKLINIVLKEKPDIIHGWMYHGNIAAFIASLFSKKKNVIWNIRHSLHTKGKEKYLTWLVIRIGAKLSVKISTILYNSNISLKQHTAIGYETNYAEVIGNGFDSEIFKPNKKVRKKFRDSLGIANTEVLIGHVSRNHPMKDHATFLTAAEILVKKINNVRFILAGKNIDFKNKYLVNILNSKGLEGKVLMVGESGNIQDFMASLDLFCLSSAWGEAFPNVLGEAMSCGVPCVATDVGDSRFIVGQAGRIVPARKPYKMAFAMEELIKLDDDQKILMGEMARQMIIENHSIKMVSSKYEKIYDRLMMSQESFNIN